MQLTNEKKISEKKILHIKNLKKKYFYATISITILKWFIVNEKKNYIKYDKPQNQNWKRKRVLALVAGIKNI